MEDQCSPLHLPFFFQEEGIEELKHSLLYTTMELESTIVCAHDEISKKDQEISYLKNLLAGIVKERDEVLEKCRNIGLEKHLLQQQLHMHFHKHLAGIAEPTAPSSATTTSNSNEDQQALSSSDSIENNVAVDAADEISPKMPLPEKGKFLQAVMEAGPLLQTLLLAGPLPEWQHPPPQLNSVDIPPVPISPTTTTQRQLLHQDSALSASGGGGCFGKKMAANGGCDSSSPSKYRKVSSLTTSPPPLSLQASAWPSL